ncbi:MAG: hypothetical protein GC157_17445 [Frankiales bacterium]|nr:hypothetical protein [Frankiales bacterium]
MRKLRHSSIDWTGYLPDFMTSVVAPILMHGDSFEHMAKYGHDRTYLADETDTRLGWVDNRTGELTVEVEAHRAALEAWVTTNVEASTPAAEAPPAIVSTESAAPAAVAVPLEPAPEPTWTDLSANRCDYLFVAADSMQSRLVFNALVHRFHTRAASRRSSRI